MYVRSICTYVRTMKNIDIWDLKILSHILLDEGGIFPPSILLTDISSFPNHHLHSLFLTLFIVLCSECHFHNTSRNTLYNSLFCSPTYTEPRDISCSTTNSIFLIHTAPLLFLVFMYVRSTRTYIRTMKNIDIWDLKILSHILLDEGGIFPPSILLTDIFIIFKSSLTLPLFNAFYCTLFRMPFQQYISEHSLQ